MADNTTLNSGSGGDTLRTEDRTTYKTPVSIIDVGGTASEKLLGDASVVFPLANTVKDASGTFYAPLVDSDGHLQVDALSAVVTNAGTFAVQESGAALTALQLIDDAVYTDGTGTPSKGLAVMGTDGTNPQIISTNTTGHVNIADGGNVISVDWNGTAPPVGAGVEATALRVTVATDSTGVLSVDDNGGSLTVDNAALSVTGGGLEASALRVTLASDSTGVLSIDDNGGSITIDDGASSITVDGTVTLQANSGVDIGDVDVISVIPGTGATNLGKAVDAAAGATDTGVAVLAIRDDALTTLTPIDGDYVPLRVNSTGALHVTGGGGGTQYNIDDAGGATDTGTVLLAIRDDSLTTLTPVDGDYVALRVSSTGALHVTGGGGGTEYNEDAATPGTITGTATMMERDDALSTLTPIEGDWAAMRCDSTGALWVTVAGISGTVSLPTGAATETTLSTLNGKVTACNTGAVVVSSGTLTALTTVSTVTNLSQLGGVAVSMGTGVRDTGTQRVTIATDDTIATLTTLTGSSVAHDGVDSGNPHKVGARASTAQSGLTLVADADRTDLLASSDGSLYVRDICLEDVVQDRATNTDGASTAFTGGLAAPGAGVRLWVKKVTISNSSASFCTVDLRDGAAGSVLWTLPVPATGGITERFDPPLKLTANTALAYDASAATTTLTISANGFKSKV